MNDEIIPVTFFLSIGHKTKLLLSIFIGTRQDKMAFPTHVEDDPSLTQ
jgi:hypothetical protein